MIRAPLTEAQILAWADAHHARIGHWPRKSDGEIAAAPGENWAAVDLSLMAGTRGLPGGSSLNRLLVQARAASGGKAVRAMSESQFLTWLATNPRGEAGLSGRKAGQTAENNSSAAGGQRPFPAPLPAGLSRGELLAWHREARRQKALPALTEAQILAWADAHHARTGRWPTAFSGLIPAAPGETWSAVNKALVRASRGLPHPTTLARLLEERRGVINHKNRPPLSTPQILAWADAHFAQRGAWPQVCSGPIAAAPGETWSAVNRALEAGVRGLPGGSSLAKLLAEQRGARNRRGLPPFTERQLLVWAAAYRDRHGRWPGPKSGPIDGAPGETWAAVEAALRNGQRGLTGGSSLARLIKENRER